MYSNKPNQHLPSKRILVLLAVIVLGFIGFGLYQNAGKVASFFTSSDDNSASGPKIAELKQTDTDNDGLSDWEERLWGTDPEVADTDGDGTPDGKEVENNRDPTDSAEDDQLSSKQKATQLASSTTENITRELNSEVLPQATILAAAKQSGTEISEEEIDFASTKIRQNVDVQKAEVSTRSDLQIIQDFTPRQADQYFDRFHQAVQITQNPSQENPLKIIAKARQENQLEQAELEPHIQQHEKAVQEVKNMPVPEQFAEPHLKSLQSLEKTLHALRRLNNIDTDPVGAVIGVKLYKQAVKLNDESAQLLIEKAQKYAKSLQ